MSMIDPVSCEGGGWCEVGGRGWGDRTHVWVTSDGGSTV